MCLCSCTVYLSLSLCQLIYIVQLHSHCGSCLVHLVMNEFACSVYCGVSAQIFVGFYVWVVIRNKYMVLHQLVTQDKGLFVHQKSLVRQMIEGY